jgi:glycosyltransferase involved in cell wall biosynthesis
MQSHILHVIDTSEIGGAQQSIFDIIHSLNEDFRFSVAILGRSGQFTLVYKNLHVPVYLLGESSSTWGLAPFIRLISLVRKIKPDAIHAHLFKSSILATFVAKIFSISLILHDHSNMSPQGLRIYFQNPFLLGTYRFLYAFCSRLSDQIIVLLPETKQKYIRNYLVPSEKLTVIPNTINLNKFNETLSPPNESLRALLGLPTDTHLVMMIGRLEPEKGWMTFVDVAAMLMNHNPPIYFIGIGEGGELQNIIEQIKILKIDNLFLLGYRPDVAQLLQQADVFLLTSLQEQFGIVILEAMAVGCPVVATRCEGPAYILSHGKTGLLAPVGDAAELAACVEWLLDHPTIRQEIAEAAKIEVAANYSSAYLAQTIQAVYSTTLKSS